MNIECGLLLTSRGLDGWQRDIVALSEVQVLRTVRRPQTLSAASPAGGEIALYK